MSSARPLNPFPGLRPFRQDEDYLFFGREEQTMELLERLGDHRFVGVVGTSGSGKSSLVRCGLLSELQGGKLLRAGASWEIAITHPGGNPLGLLAEAIIETDLYDREEEDVRERLLATLSRSHFGLVEAVKQARLAEGTNFLLVVDQFEEIFRFNEAGDTQQELANEFVAILLAAVSQAEVPIYVVITMRSDFIGDCGQFEGLAEMVNRGEFLIPRLTREQYRRAIESPIKVAGGQITPRLLQRLLNDLGQQADQLPCLQHALMRTWAVARRRGESAPLDLEDYQSVGKMSRALSLHADEIYDSLGGDRQRELCANIFKALTVQESENRGIRRPQRLSSLCHILEAPASELIGVIDAFRQHGVTFLTPAPEVELNANTIIDISHESLMRVWDRLRHWVEEEYQAAGIYRRLSESAALFAQEKMGLYRDPELAIALSWRESRKPNEAWAARYHLGFAAAMEFLNQSQAAARRALDEREAARQHELDQANRLAEAQRMRAEEQKRAAVRLRRLVAGLAVVAVIALGGFALAAKARQEAEGNARRARVAQGQAVNAAKTARDALADVKRARDDAQRAGKEERKQRQVAETQRAAAVQAQKDLQTALAQAESARKDAENATRRAKSSQQQAEADRKLAAEAERQAVSDRMIAEREKLLAETNAELARRREKLFEKLLPLLQEHASAGVLQYARKLQDEGKPRQALDTFADFCDLVLGDQQSGLSARELLDLSSFELQGIDAEVVGLEISVPPLSLFTDVLMPAIQLGEEQLESQPDVALRSIVAALYAHRARLLQQHPQENWPAGDSVAKMTFDSFDRAAALEPESFEHYLGRAAARFRLPDRDLAATLQDLDTAMACYPDPPAPPADSDPPTDAHRQFARLHHARANVLEHLADAEPAQERVERLRDAEQSQRQAAALDPSNPAYLAGIARTLRKRIGEHEPDPEAGESLRDAEAYLAKAIALDDAFPDAYNELGELYLVESRLADARGAFENAIKHGKQAGKKRSLYMYYCNWANVCTRDSADRDAFQVALNAADQAIALGREAPVEGHYYRGLSLWKLGRTKEALSEFSEVARLEPAHVEARLAKCQIVFEMQPPNAPADALLKQAYADVRDVLKHPQLTADEQAKAYYVNSLGWLRYHIHEKSEDALIKCLESALKGVRGSSAYAAFARQVFSHASAFAWRDSRLQQESSRLQKEFKALMAAETPSSSGAAP